MRTVIPTVGGRRIIPRQRVGLCDGVRGRADRSQLATDYPEYLQDYWASNRDVSRIRPRSIPLMREYWVPVSKLAESMWLTWDQDPRTYFEMNTPHSYRADRTPCAVQENDSTWSVVASDGRAAVLTFELGEQVVGFPAFTIDAPRRGR
ncbi:MAG: hypothetical protein ACLR8Y_09315 [Alistipes indistinctus]